MEWFLGKKDAPLIPTAVYCRVSTDSQELEQQVAACLNYCKMRGLAPTVFQEIGSGKDFARPEFNRMLAELRAGKFKALVAFRFDRLGRNSRELVVLFEELENRGIQVISIHENFDTSTPIGRGMREILLILGRMEREQIALATQQRLQALKRLGKKLGRKPVEFDIDKASRLRAEGMSWSKMAKTLGVKASTIRLRLSQVATNAPANSEQLVRNDELVPASVGDSCKVEEVEKDGQ